MDIETSVSLHDAAQCIANSEYVTVYIYCYETLYGHRIYWLTTSPVETPKATLIGTHLAQMSDSDE